MKGRGRGGSLRRMGIGRVGGRGEIELRSGMVAVVV